MISPVGYGSQRLRSVAHGNFAVPQTQTVRLGPRNFAVSGPTNIMELNAGRIKNYADPIGNL